MEMETEVEAFVMVTTCNVEVRADRLPDIERLLVACPSIEFTHEHSRDVHKPEIIRIHYTGTSTEVHWFEYVIKKLEWANHPTIAVWASPLTWKERISGLSSRVGKS